MPIPGLTSVPQFIEWLKYEYIKKRRGPLLITSVGFGNRIMVEGVPPAVIEGEFKIISHDEIKENKNE